MKEFVVLAAMFLFLIAWLTADRITEDTWSEGNVSLTSALEVAPHY